MASPNEEIFWALTTINEVMSAVITANKKVGTPQASQIERDWITIYTVVINSVSDEINAENEAEQAAVSLLNQLGIQRQT